MEDRRYVVEFRATAGLKRILDGESIHGLILVDTGMAFAGVQAACEWGAEFADETMVRDSQVAEFQGEAHEVGEEVGGVDAAVNEDGTVDVGMEEGAEGR